MPLRAWLLDRELVAPLLTDDEWTDLRERSRAAGPSLRMACCQAPGYPRTSDLGTRHFVHHPGHTCCSDPESALHLLAKSIVARACGEAGATVRTEAGGPDWRADVLVTHRGRTLAFEIQLSQITMEQIRDRELRYRRDAVHAIWLIAHWPRRHEPDRELAAFRLHSEPALSVTTDVTSSPVRMDLASFCRHVLAEQAVFCSMARAAPSQETRLVFLEHRCRGCRAVNHLPVATTPYTSICGLELWPGAMTESRTERLVALSSRPEIGIAVRTLLRSQTCPGVRQGLIAVHPDQHGRPALSVGCVVCGRPLDRIDFRRAIGEMLRGRPPVREALARVQVARVEEPLPHWCAWGCPSAAG